MGAGMLLHGNMNGTAGSMHVNIHGNMHGTAGSMHGTAWEHEWHCIRARMVLHGSMQGPAWEHEGSCMGACMALQVNMHWPLQLVCYSYK